MTLLFMLIITFSTLFMFLSHPLSFGLILLLQTISVSLITGMMNYNYWFSYILFLVMVGGMLILFIYMTSVASNEKFKFSFKILVVSLIFAIFSISLTLIDLFFSNYFLSTFDLTSQSIYSKNELSMTKFLNWPSSSVLALMITYLLITLIMVVKITNVQYGPLRQKF
uniref:NADH-ubiquinone oxidoreductase chain 6 n=1 Tax=Neoplocaederus obesus TaxID=2735254 RepID=A0A7D4XMY5_9CUCU|nr:NADH dehydrogenase subunit 6 [Neoplocaederus obesus]QKW88548.1 NADH dehydrogenase subunit 6 [Neoplocaederus obesus]